MNSVIKNVMVSGATIALVLPGIAAAATLADILKTVSSLIGMIIPIILALAIVYFMWGVLQYVTKGGEEQTEARNTMLWGIIAIAVMVSIWGLVGILQSTFGIQSTAAPQNLQLIPTAQNPQ